MSERRETSRDRDSGRSRTRDDGEGRSRTRDEPDRGRDRGGRDDPPPRRSRDDDRGGRSSGRRFEYQERDKADVDKRMNQGGKDFDKYIDGDVKMFSVNDGDNAIRLLPPTWRPTRHYGLDIYVHYGVGPDRQTYLCLNKMQDAAMDFADRIEKDEPDLASALRANKGKCPICEERELILRDGDEKHAKELDAKKRVLVYMIDRDGKKEGLQAWAMPWTVDRDIVSVSVDKRTGAALPIDHPDEGFDIFFKKTGQKDRTEYTGVQVDRHASRLGDDAWLDEAMDRPLPEILVFFDYDHISNVFGGGGGAVRDEPRGRGRDRDDDRGGRGRDRDDPPARGRGRDDDDRGSRRRDPEPPPHTWESVHKLEGKALDDLIDEEQLDLDPQDFKSDEELADAICLKLDLEEARRGREPEPEGRRRSVPEDDDPRARLREMRERRSRD